MNRVLTALTSRSTILLLAVTMLVALPVALYAIDNASAREQRDRDARSSPPVSIKLVPSPLRIDCNGTDVSRLTVTLRDKHGNGVRNGTEVYFDVRNGFADPVETKTRNGQATTKVRLYPSAAFYGGGQVFVEAGDLRASVYIDCKPAGPIGCNEPFPPPLHPMSPPCETPTPPPGCSFSPPQHPMSPPCLEPTLSSPIYSLALEGKGEPDNTLTVFVQIRDLGGGPYRAAQWNVDYDERKVDVVSIQPVAKVASLCEGKSDNGLRVLLGCVQLDRERLIDYFGDVWQLRFRCLEVGAVEFRLPTDPNTAGPTSVYDAEAASMAIVATGLQLQCDGAALGVSPSPTPPPNCYYDDNGELVCVAVIPGERRD